jgi:hypothetical protein
MDKIVFYDISSDVTKKKTPDINAEPQMIELKRMIRSGELDGERTIKIMSEIALLTDA